MAMRIIVTLTIDGSHETRIEGDGRLFNPEVEMSGDKLEQENIGFWLSNWRYAEVGSPNHKSRVFCPWTSVLMVETKEVNDNQ